MAFRPEDYRPSESEQKEREGDGTVPDGQYGFAIISIHHKKGGEGRDKWAIAKFKARVLWAEQKHEKYVGSTIFLDCGYLSDGQKKMLGTICYGMGLTNEDEFEPSDVRQMRRAMLYRPMFASLRVTTQGRYKNLKWGRVHASDKWSEAMAEKVKGWREDLIQEFGDPAQQEAESDQGGGDYGGDDDPGPGDNDAPQGRSNFF